MREFSNICSSWIPTDVFFNFKVNQLKRIYHLILSFCIFVCVCVFL